MLLIFIFTHTLKSYIIETNEPFSNYINYTVIKINFLKKCKYFVGYYVYTEVSSPRQPGQKARLLSGLQSSYLKPACMTFWYHMYGSQIGTLNVYLKQGRSNSLGSPIWTRKANQGNSWNIAQVSLNPSSAYQVMKIICL